MGKEDVNSFEWALIVILLIAAIFSFANSMTVTQNNRILKENQKSLKKIESFVDRFKKIEKE